MASLVGAGVGVTGVGVAEELMPQPATSSATASSSAVCLLAKYFTSALTALRV